MEKVNSNDVGENSLRISGDSLSLRILDGAFVLWASLTFAFQACLIASVPAWYFYPVAAIVLMISGFLLFRFRSKGSGSIRVTSDEKKCFLFSFLLVVGSLFYFRISYDDMWYFHNAVYQLSRLDEPFFRIPMAFKDDRLAESLVSSLPAYKVIPALIAKPLGIDPVYFYRQILSATSVFLFPLIYREWFRRLGFKGGLPLAGVLGVILFLVLDANSRQSFGVYSVGLYWVGRCLLIGIILPALWLYVDRLLEEPRLKNAVLLLGVTIAAIGASSSSFFLLPSMVLGMVVVHLAIHRFGRESWKGSLLLLASLSYWLIVMGFVLFEKMNSKAVAGNIKGLMSRMYDDSFISNLQNVYDNYWKLAAYVTGLLVLPFFMMSRKKALLICGFSVGVMVVIFNPVTGPVLQNAVTRLAFSRFFYLLPVPLVFGLAVIALIRWKASPIAAGIALLVIGLNFAGMRQTLFQPHAKYRHDYSVFKMPHHPRYFLKEYQAFGELRDELEGRYILAPKHFMMVAGIEAPQHKYESTRELMTLITYRAAGLEEEGMSRGHAQQFVEKAKEQTEETEKGFREALKRGVNLIVVEMECTDKIEAVFKSENVEFSVREIAGIYRVYFL